jgi:Contractile injection system tube protein/LysM domain
MELQKLSIQPDGKPSFSVLFNPTQYTVAKANQIAEAGIPGLSAPVLQYVHGNTRTLSMDLFFDTYEERMDVSSDTEQIYGLLQIDGSTHAPPVCDLQWGTFLFTGILDHVSGQFTLFLSDGTPVRATLSVSFKEFIDVEQLVRVDPTQSADHRKRRMVKSGDRIDTVAAEEYGDPAQWRAIAEANGMDDPAVLRPGQMLTIPPLI